MENNPEIAPAPAAPVTLVKSSTAKDFFLWLGFIITFFGSITSLITLIFTYIDIAYPDLLAPYTYVSEYTGTVSYAMATLIVMAPAAAILMHFIRRDILQDPARGTFWVRRWAVIFTIFIFGSTIVGDLITLLTTFLNGEITNRFLLKVVVLFLIAFAVLLHFIADSWGYWVSNRHKATMVGVAALILCLITIGAGFVLIGSPSTVRLENFDNQKASNLREIQADILAFADQNRRLPDTLTELHESSAGYSISLNDSQTKQPYEYKLLKSNSYELCAIFNRPTSTTGTDPNDFSGATDSFQWHEEGQVCSAKIVSFRALSPAEATTTIPK